MECVGLAVTVLGLLVTLAPDPSGVNRSTLPIDSPGSLVKVVGVADGSLASLRGETWPCVRGGCCSTEEEAGV